MSDAVLEEQAPAKLNLDLLVAGRRADGYHDLDSLVAFADVGDRLTFAPADGLVLDVQGPFAAALPPDADNLIVRAAKRLAGRAGIETNARIGLDKRLPVMAGIGGGSADAAAALRGLNRLWRLGLEHVDLCDLGLALGADVPVCVASVPCRVRGVGGRLDPVRGLPELPLLLVNPGVGLKTADVFAGLDPASLDPASRDPLPMMTSPTQFAVWLQGSRNDLEAPARRLAPAVDDALAALAGAGAVLARMSGSGATCFGLFPDRDARDQAAANLNRPGWWVCPTSIVG